MANCGSNITTRLFTVVFIGTELEPIQMNCVFSEFNNNRFDDIQSSSSSIQCVIVVVMFADSPALPWK